VIIGLDEAVAHGASCQKSAWLNNDSNVIGVAPI
jgi:hypothetical protein